MTATFWPLLPTTPGLGVWGWMTVLTPKDCHESEAEESPGLQADKTRSHIFRHRPEYGIHGGLPSFRAGVGGRFWGDYVTVDRDVLP